MRKEDGKWSVAQDGPDLKTLKPVFAILRPALDAVADWWERVQGRVEAMPDPEKVKAELAGGDDPLEADLAPEQAVEETGPGF